MQVKINLHSHSREDVFDRYIINYDIYKLIDEAERFGFGALALTCHKKYIYNEDFKSYAQGKGVLLISGIELEIKKHFIFKSHVVVLNCDSGAEKIKTFDDLSKYKKNNPQSFILAPHPNFGFIESIESDELIKYVDIFDAIEYSWCYTKLFNINKKNQRIVDKYKKPFISTSDTHVLKYLNTDYAIVDARDFSVESILASIKNGNFKNITAAKGGIELIIYFIKGLFFYIINKLKVLIKFI